MYVCMSIYIYIHVYIYIYIYIHTHIYIYTHTHTHTHIQYTIYIHTCIYISPVSVSGIDVTKRSSSSYKLAFGMKSASTSAILY